MSTGPAFEIAHEVEALVAKRAEFYFEAYLNAHSTPIAPKLLKAWADVRVSGKTYDELLHTAIHTSNVEAGRLGSAIRADWNKISEIAGTAFELFEGYDPNSHEPRVQPPRPEIKGSAEATAEVMNHGVLALQQLLGARVQFAGIRLQARELSIAGAGIGLLSVIRSGQLRSWDETVAALLAELFAQLPGIQAANVWTIVKKHLRQEQDAYAKAAEVSKSIEGFSRAASRCCVLMEVQRGGLLLNPLPADFPRDQDFERAQEVLLVRYAAEMEFLRRVFSG